MQPCRITHLADHALLQSFEQLLTQDRGRNAELIAHIGEIDARRLYLPAGCSSMFDYCVRVWHMSEESAYKRIRAARAARSYPALLEALAEGRVHLSAIVALAAHLTPVNCDELLTAATHKTRAEVEHLLAARFPRPDVPTMVVPHPIGVASELRESGASAQATPSPSPQLSPGTVVPSSEPGLPLSMGPLLEQAPGALSPGARLKPLSPGRYALQVTVDQETYEFLQRAKDLLAHAGPSVETADVLRRALQLLVKQLEQRKFAETDSPRARRSHANGRYIPAEIKRAVWQRDGGRCTFVSEGGRRCVATARLEFDHIRPVARRGQTTTANLRLRCRAHNQFEASQTYGEGFMREKRDRDRSRGAGASASVRAAISN